jgi:hypothetical protein
MALFDARAELGRGEDVECVVADALEHQFAGFLGRGGEPAELPREIRLRR